MPTKTKKKKKIEVGRTRALFCTFYYYYSASPFLVGCTSDRSLSNRVLCAKYCYLWSNIPLPYFRLLDHPSRTLHFLQ